MRKIAFVFAGQGSQKVGMGKDFYDQFPIYKDVIERTKVGFDLKEISFSGPPEILSQTKFTQPCMVAFAVGVTKLLYEKGIKPTLVAGFSLGEYSALYAAGAVKEEDVIPLVHFRGKAMENAVLGCDCGMSAVLGLDREKLEDACASASAVGIVEIANYNCPGQLVISGEKQAVKKAEELALERGAKRCIPLNVSGPFHTSLMKKAGDALEKELEHVNFSDMQVPVIFNATANFLEKDESVKNMLVRQIQHSVYFEDTIKLMEKQGITTVVEIGPGKVLSGFVRKTSKNIETFVVENTADFEKVVEALKG